MTIRSATSGDLPAIIALFHRSNDTPHDLAAVAGEKVFLSGWRHEADPLVAVEADRILGLAVRSGNSLRLLAVDRDHRRAGIGSELLREAERRARGEAFDFLRVGAEAGNYFVPGVPEHDLAVQSFFDHHDYRDNGERSLNLEVDLAATSPADDARVKRVTRQDAAEALAYIGTFAGAWRYEAERALLNEPPTLFVMRERGSIAGFSAHNANNRGLGWFGPAGVSPAERNRGFGAVLARASFADLRAAGFCRSTVPWASSVEFYERVAGASVKETFRLMEKNLLR